MKYVGIWWAYAHQQSGPGAPVQRHGATTENTRRYVDFAADNGFGGVLVEGWNIGWDGDWGANADLFSFTESYPDYDLEGLAAYASQRGVSGSSATTRRRWVSKNYERQLEDAFALYERLGIRAIKTGYVGDQDGRRPRPPRAVHGAALADGPGGRGAAPHYGQRARADKRHWRTADLSQHDDQGGCAGSGIQRLGT